MPAMLARFARHGALAAATAGTAAKISQGAHEDGLKPSPSLVHWGATSLASCVVREESSGRGIIEDGRGAIQYSARNQSALTKHGGENALLAIYESALTEQGVGQDMRAIHERDMRAILHKHMRKLFSSPSCVACTEYVCDDTVIVEVCEPAVIGKEVAQAQGSSSAEASGTLGSLMDHAVLDIDRVDLVDLRGRSIILERRDLMEKGEFFPLAEMGLLDLNGGPWTINAPVSPIQHFASDFDSDVDDLAHLMSNSSIACTSSILKHAQSLNVWQYIADFLHATDARNVAACALFLEPKN